MILFINACVRGESRTKILADVVLEELSRHVEHRRDGVTIVTSEDVGEVNLEKIILPTTGEEYLARRDELCRAKKFDDPMFELARQFAEADRIVIAAPYWDLSFPAALKQYIEHINVTGITFEYTEEGIPQGLCRAKEIHYVTTAGGDYAPDEFGFGYIKALANGYYGIPEVKLYKATGLDIVGADVKAIMDETIASVRNEKNRND